MMLRRFSCSMFVATVACSVFCSWVYAEALTPRAQIEARQSNFKDLGGAFKTIRDQLRISRPNPIAIEQAAQSVYEMSQEHANWFPKGTGPESGYGTDAKPEIWNDASGFAAANKRFAEEGAKLYALAQAKNIDELKKYVPMVGQACKGCHDKYRLPQD